MLTGNAKRIFCENVTCFGTNTCCSNRSHRPKSGSSKLPTSGLHGYSVSSTENPRFFYFFWEAMFATPPIVLAGAIHTLLWKMRLEKCPFSLFSMASSLVLFVFGHAVETPHLGDVSARVLPTYTLQLLSISVSCLLLSRKSVQTSGDLSMEQVRLKM